MLSKSFIHQAKLQEWPKHCSDQKTSGLTVTEWCYQNNLSKHKFFYWKHLLKEEALSQALPDIVPVFIPTASPKTLPLPIPDNTSCTTRATCITDSCATIQKGDITIELNSLASEDFILSLIKAVRNA